MKDKSLIVIIITTLIVVAMNLAVIGLGTYAVCWAFNIPFQWTYVIGIYVALICAKAVFKGGGA